MASSANWRDYVSQLSVPWMQRDNAAVFYGLLALIADEIAEGVKLALRANWLLEETSPDDVLAKIGRERRLQRYPVETPAQHRARLHQAWTTWQQAGGDPNLVTQFAAAGWAPVFIWDNVDIHEWESPHDTTNVSRFWVVLDPTAHSFVHDGLWDDPGTWDDGGLWDVGNMTFEQLQTMRGIIRKFKPFDWKCEAILLVLAWDNPAIVAADAFDNAAWIKGASATITPDDIAGPTVGTFGDRLENTSGSPTTSALVHQTPTNIDAGRYTHYRFRAKAGTTDWVMYFDGVADAAWFDLTNGVVGSFGTASAFITDLGNGWYLCDAVTDATNPEFWIHAVDGDSSINCPTAGSIYLHQAEIYNNKMADYITLGAT